ncbi:MAG: TrmH family RNA methyltransferase [Parachlamydiaceae bacterium]|nr:TrmH family RNA methyltransferase [Parachlamydiaceae bacterium]
MPFDFTKRKFSALPIGQKHKKCAEFLSFIFNQSDEKERKAILDAYKDLLLWMNDDTIINGSIKQIADRYHWHLQQANICKKEHHFLPQVRTGDRLVAEELWPIDIYLDHIRSAHNVGSILRTVEAFSLGTIYFSEQTPYIDHKQVQDTSMGAFEWVLCKRGTALKELAKPIIALETTQEAIPLHKFIFPEAFTLVVGNEEYGCSEESLKMADYIVEIPLRGRKNSLNVANAFSIVAGEICRQKNLTIVEEINEKKDY